MHPHLLHTPHFALPTPAPAGGAPLPRALRRLPAAARHARGPHCERGRTDCKGRGPRRRGHVARARAPGARQLVGDHPAQVRLHTVSVTGGTRAVSQAPRPSKRSTMFVCVVYKWGEGSLSMRQSVQDHPPQVNI
eukprot:365272-Chlamydomonas_euryale.AAC.3